MVKQSQVCDFKPDCPNSNDELQCGKSLLGAPSCVKGFLEWWSLNTVNFLKFRRMPENIAVIILKIKNDVDLMKSNVSK